jgi:hypothetical protein
MFVMGRLALIHRGTARTLPPADLLEPLIERTSMHWYWLGDFVDDGMDRSAVFRWAAPDENAGQYMVPRLLWQMANPHENPKRVLLENMCGLFTCVNPAHWQRRRGAFKIPARIVLPDTVEALPVVHHRWAVVVHILRNDAASIVCGHHVGRSSAYQHLARTATITCEECISSWARLGQPYMEVK